MWSNVQKKQRRETKMRKAIFLKAYTVQYVQHNLSYLGTQYQSSDLIRSFSNVDYLARRSSSKLWQEAQLTLFFILACSHQNRSLQHPTSFNPHTNPGRRGSTIPNDCVAASPPNDKNTSSSLLAGTDCCCCDRLWSWDIRNDELNSLSQSDHI